MHRLKIAVLLIAVGAVGSAHAAPITFDFDSTAITNNTSTPTSNAAIQAYMNIILPGIVVTGAGGLSNSNYTGDGHVVGPLISGTVNPLTLGDTNGGVLDSPVPTAAKPDGYIVNNGSDRITLVLPMKVNWVSFDFEIFPDGTCPSLTNCGGIGTPNLPDFELLADGVPATNWVQMAAAPVSANSRSVLRPGGGEATPQYLGTLSIAVNGASTLQFVDWPQRIGIDNLVLRTVPEPGTLALLGVGLFGLRAFRRRT